MQSRGDAPSAEDAVRKKALTSAIEMSRRGMSERALERLAPLVEKDAKDAEAWSAIGVVQSRLGHQVDAAKALSLIHI